MDTTRCQSTWMRWSNVTWHFAKNLPNATVVKTLIWTSLISATSLSTHPSLRWYKKLSWRWFWPTLNRTILRCNNKEAGQDMIQKWWSSLQPKASRITMYKRTRCFWSASVHSGKTSVKEVSFWQSNSETSTLARFIMAWLVWSVTKQSIWLGKRFSCSAMGQDAQRQCLFSKSTRATRESSKSHHSKRD